MVAIAMFASAQEPPTIRVDVDVVNVLCTVRNRMGILVNSLKADDFIVLENGQPQEIRHFGRETDLPLTVGLLVDTSNSQVRLIGDERRAAAQFFAQVIRPKDSAFLMSFDAKTELLMEHAGSQKSIKAGLERLNQNSPQMHPSTGTARPRGTLLYDAVSRAASEQLKKEPGRKAIVLITDGMDVGSKGRVDDAIDAAQKADTIIYSIYYVDSKAYGSARASQPGMMVLRDMSDQTGGRFFRADKVTPLKKIFEEIQQEMRSQYSLEFTSSDERKDGSFRRLEVLLRPSGLRAQARKGYYAVR